MVRKTRISKHGIIREADIYQASNAIIAQISDLQEKITLIHESKEEEKTELLAQKGFNAKRHILLQSLFIECNRLFHIKNVYDAMLKSLYEEMNYQDGEKKEEVKQLVATSQEWGKKAIHNANFDRQVEKLRIITEASERAKLSSPTDTSIMEAIKSIQKNGEEQ